MNIIENIQNKVLSEGLEKAATSGRSKILSVRPSPHLSALIEVLAFLDGKSPSEFIYRNFGRALADFTKLSDEHVSVLNDAVIECEKTVGKQYKSDCALDCLYKDGVISDTTGNSLLRLKKRMSASD